MHDIKMKYGPKTEPGEINIDGKYGREDQNEDEK